MKFKIYLLSTLIMTNPFFYSYSNHSRLIDANEIKDSSITKYSDNQSIWGIRLGYFPIYGDYLETSGISGTFYNGNAISKYFNLGWSFQLNKALGSDGGYMSLSSYLSYAFFVGDQKFFIKGGLGLATLGYINPVAMFEVEYIVFDFEKTAISVSIQKSFPELPFIISIGILF